jgi:opacity protein-like surface antigen
MRISILALIAAFGLAGGTAFAADYEPPLTVAEAPEYVPVEIGSGWYLRGDIGYDINDPYDDGDFGNSFLDDAYDSYPISGSVGFGYHFTDYLRADINLGYLAGDQFAFDSFTAGPITATADVRNKNWYGMLNGYVDLGTYAGITPYVGAGIGLMRSDRRFDATFDDGAGGGFSYDSHDVSYSMAYSLNAGLAYQVTPNLAIDVGYQYLSAPSAEYTKINSISDYEVEEGLSFHQIRVGLRYDLW